MKKKIARGSGSANLFLVGLVGFAFAGTVFLVTFITTQKAHTPYQPKLKTITLSPPPRPVLPPLRNGTVKTPLPTPIPTAASPSATTATASAGATGSATTPTIGL